MRSEACLEVCRGAYGVIKKWILTGMVAATAALCSGVALAADPTPTPRTSVIIIAKEAFNLPINQSWRPDVRRLADAVLSISAFADGQACATVDLRDNANVNASGDKVIVLGLPGQPAACGREGASLVFVDGRGREIAADFTVRLGAVQRLIGLAPRPPTTGDAGLSTGDVPSVEAAAKDSGGTRFPVALAAASVAAALIGGGALVYGGLSRRRRQA
jgi:hypothetical protein